MQQKREPETGVRAFGLSMAKFSVCVLAMAMAGCGLDVPASVLAAEEAAASTPPGGGSGGGGGPVVDGADGGVDSDAGTGDDGGAGFDASAPDDVPPTPPPGPGACPPTFDSHDFHDTYWKAADGSNSLTPLSSPGSFQVCDYSDPIPSDECEALGQLSTSGPHGDWCQLFTDSSRSMLLSLARGGLSGCAPTFIGHPFHDTYFRNGVSDFFDRGTDPGTFQVCDYDGSVTLSDCLAEPGAFDTGYCQAWADSSNTILNSLVLSR